MSKDNNLQSSSSYFSGSTLELFCIAGVVAAVLTILVTGATIKDHTQANQVARFRESPIDDQLNSVFRGVATVICQDTATGKEYVLPVRNLDEYRTALVNKCRVALTP